MLAHLRFGSGRKNRLGQLAGVFQPWRQGHAAYGLTLLVLLPSATSQIAAHHGFYRNRLEALDQHRTACDLRQLCCGDHAFRRVTRQVVRADVAQFVKPEQRHLREQRTFSGNGLAQNHVKRADAVAGHHQQAVGADGVIVADFASGEQGK